MRNPTVSFVIPCYKLGHLLPECVNSILSQTYSDFEVLIMDDCSPDNTVDVARSYRDPRIKHVRNERNLGHLRNYNKGIGMSRGKYVWLISADDYLRRPYILRRYVEFMEKHPGVGYTFCPGIGISNGRETDLMGYYGNRDRILKGHTFLKKLLNYNFVLAPSAMARRECYEKISLFPLDAVWAGLPVEMGWVGDWYLWCVFALCFDVGYFAEPMVCYREHDLSMTNTLTRQNIESCVAADIAVPWLIRQKANERGLRKVSKVCLLGIAHEYAAQGAGKQYRSFTSSMSIGQLEESLCRSTQNEKERNWIRARLFEGIADNLWSRGDSLSARKFYLLGLQKDWRMAKVYAKLLLLWFGKPGDYVRRLVRSVRTMAINRLLEGS
jgi:hypothetical protein